MDVDRHALGRRMMVAGPNIEEQVQLFYRWAAEASIALQGPQFKPVLDDKDRVVAVEHALGRFEVAQELSRIGDELFARIVFLQPPTALRKEPREIYVVRVFEEGAHFGPGPEADPFEWDHHRDRWASRNWLRISYELALGATESLAQLCAARGKID